MVFGRKRQAVEPKKEEPAAKAESKDEIMDWVYKQREMYISSMIDEMIQAENEYVMRMDRLVEAVGEQDANRRIEEAKQRAK